MRAGQGAGDAENRDRVGVNHFQFKLMKTQLSVPFLALPTLILMLGLFSCCSDCSLTGDAIKHNNDNNGVSGSESSGTINFVPTEGDCINVLVANSSNPYDERGVFHNAFMDYFVENYVINAVDTAGYKQDCASGLLEFALQERSNYNFLPDDSSACVTYITDVTSNYDPYYEYDCFDYLGNPAPVNLGLSVDALAELDSLNDIIADLRDSVISMSQAITNIKTWEGNIYVSSSSELERLYTAGSVARHSIYYWGCYIYNEDSTVSKLSAAERRSFFKFLERNWLSIAAFDIGGAYFFGICGAAISSGGAALLGWALGF